MTASPFGGSVYSSPSINMPKYHRRHGRLFNATAVALTTFFLASLFLLANIFSVAPLSDNYHFWSITEESEVIRPTESQEFSILVVSSTASANFEDDSVIVSDDTLTLPDGTGRNEVALERQQTAIVEHEGKVWIFKYKSPEDIPDEATV